MEKQVIRISVRSLVEFLLRSGDIDNRTGAYLQKEAMQEGARIHRKLQKRRGAGYLAEVPLAEEYDFDRFVLRLEGRADGIFMEKDPVCIEEIKGVYADPERMEGPVPVHLAQAKCYAAMYGQQQGLETVSVRMTYVSMETEEIRQFTDTYTVADLGIWIGDLIGQYGRWAEMQVDWTAARNASMEGLPFPFSYRQGQREMVAAVWHTISEGKQLFVQAPTGIGKTMSAIFPAVRAVGEGKAGKIFYLTAKTISRTVAEEGFAILRDRGLRFRTVTLTAKEKVCVCEAPDCNPEACPRAAGHYDRINDALYDMISSGETWTREDILRQAEKYCVCPHELELDLSLFADCVICDYNYAFDPRAKLRRFFGEGAGKGEYLFLVDEAHNLVGRGREMFSAVLVREDLCEARKAVKGKLPALHRALNRCCKTMLDYRKECPDSALRERTDCGSLILQLTSLTGILEETLSEFREEPLREQLLELWFSLRTFLAVWELVDDHYIIYEQAGSGNDWLLKLFCVNPAANLQAVLDCGKGTVFFSATMVPAAFYRDMLSTREDNYALQLPSPFDPGKRLLLVGRDVSSRYTRRGPEEYRRIAGWVLDMAAGRKGNYLVFLPSYRMLEDISEAFREMLVPEAENPGEKSESRTISFAEETQEACGSLLSAEETQEACDGLPSAEKTKKVPDRLSSAEETTTVQESQPSVYRMPFPQHECIRILIQQPGMRENEREAFLETFREDPDMTQVGFVVMGGIFAEGIDLTGERLIGAAVVGTGLPQISAERDLLKTYFDRNGKDGYAYAYRIPGMNRVAQAAGRVIRTDTDKGVILLLDDRFSREDHRMLFPADWAGADVCRVTEGKEKIRAFWSRNAETEEP